MSRLSHCLIAMLIATLSVASTALSAAGAQRAPQPVDQAVLDDLAPSGELRVAINPGNAAYGHIDPESGELRGPAVDLGSELATRLGVSYAPTRTGGWPRVVREAPADLWDVAFFVIGEGLDVLDTTPALMEGDYTYLVPPGSALSRLADIDQPGIRIAYVSTNTQANLLGASLEHAELVLVEGPPPAGLELLASGQVDVLTHSTQELLVLADELAGSRVLDERYGGFSFGLAVPKGRASGLAYLSDFVQEMKASGFVQQALDRHSVRGIRVAMAAISPTTLASSRTPRIWASDVRGSGQSNAGDGSLAGPPLTGSTIDEPFIGVARQREGEVFALLSEQPVAEARGVSE